MKNPNELGIKKNTLEKLIRQKGLNLNTKNIALTKKHLLGIKKINSYDSKKVVEQTNVSFLMELNNYKGNRHSLHLPVRGQRSRTNARTAKKRRRIKIEL